MEEQAASRAAGFNAPRTLQREILKPGDRAVDLRERLRQHLGEISAGDVELVIAHSQEQIPPAFWRQPFAGRGHLVNERRRWSEQEAGCHMDCQRTRCADSPRAVMEHGAQWQDRGRGRQSRRSSEKAATCPRGESSLMHSTAPLVVATSGARHRDARSGRWRHPRP